MSAELATATNPSSDLPPRSWHQWWRELPGYWRIGAWTALVLALLHVTLAVRMGMGLIEDSRITALRNRGAVTYYFWEDDRAPPKPQGDPFVASLYGRSCRNVKNLSLREFPAVTIAEFEEMLRIFPNLETIDLTGQLLTSHDLKLLKTCRALRTLMLCDTDIDDQVADHLVELPQLEMLCLQGTQVTDAVVPRLERIKSLKRAWVFGTNISAATIQDHPVFQKNFPQRAMLFATSCWSNDRKSFCLKLPFTLSIDGTQPSKTTTTVQKFSQPLGVPVIRPASLIDGDYRLTLTIGEYESQPAMINVVKGEATPRTVEFQMPCTKAEALRAAAAHPERGASAP